MSYAACNQEAILGRLLMDIVHGDLTDETIAQIDQLDPDDLALPMLHLVRYIQGMNRASHMRVHINRDLLDELRIITIEQSEDLCPRVQTKNCRHGDQTLPSLIGRYRS